MAYQTFQQEYLQMPVVTRTYATACVVTTLAVVRKFFWLGFDSFDCVKQVKKICLHATASVSHVQHSVPSVLKALFFVFVLSNLS